MSCCHIPYWKIAPKTTPPLQLPDVFFLIMLSKKIVREDLYNALFILPKKHLKKHCFEEKHDNWDLLKIKACFGP
jgi:hypothetical protein